MGEDVADWNKREEWDFSKDFPVKKETNLPKILLFLIIGVFVVIIILIGFFVVSDLRKSDSTQQVGSDQLASTGTDSTPPSDSVPLAGTPTPSVSSGGGGGGGGGGGPSPSSDTPTSPSTSTCSFSSATWGVTTLAVGDTAQLTSIGSGNCAGENVNFKIYKKLSGGGSTLIYQISSVAYSSSISGWNTQWTVASEDDALIAALGLIILPLFLKSLRLRKKGEFRAIYLVPIIVLVVIVAIFMFVPQLNLSPPSGTLYYFEASLVSDPAIKIQSSTDLVLIGNNPPTAQFTQDVMQGQAGIEVSFDASASTDADGTIQEYLWNFGDGQTATGQFTSHAFNNPGVYPVSLTVTDNDADTDSSAPTNIAVYVYSECTGDLDGSGDITSADRDILLASYTSVAGSCGNVCPPDLTSDGIVDDFDLGTILGLEGTSCAAPNERLLTVNVVGLGTVTSNPAGINCPGDCTESYLISTPITLTANHAAGITYTWTGIGACSGPAAPCSFILQSSTTVTATFTVTQPH